MTILSTISPRALSAPESGIVEVVNYARGRDGLIPLWVGEGDLPTPAFISDVARDALAGGETFYTWQRGIPPLREALSRLVADGLAELDRWLGDQVSGGLARAAQDPYGWSESIAARMVDAQAPGIASWLRRLPAVVASGPGWPGRLLDELAMLHLLARGYARRAELPADLLATVRDHIGFTVSRADVLAGPSVWDQWVVVFFRDLDTELVSTRRVWLRGNRSGRWAQVLFFAAGGAGLDSSLIPGTVLNADLHFYPGRAGLRASLGATYGEAVPLTDWEPAAGTVAVVADNWATALAADPWQHQIPVVLRGLVDHDERGWTFTDTAGISTVVHGDDLDLWRLLALTAGTVVDVAGEWSPAGFRPASVIRAGQLVGL